MQQNFWSGEDNRLAQRRVGHRLLQVVRTECPREKLIEGLNPRRRHDLEFAAAVLEEQLTATSAGSEVVSFSINADNCNKPSTPGVNEVGDQSALGAQADAVTGILDIATGDGSTIINERGNSDWKVGVRRVCVLHCALRCLVNCLPINVHSESRV